MRERGAPRSALACSEARPLFGRRILVTRPPDGEDALARALREAGAEVRRLPLLEIRAVSASDALDAALRRGAHCDAWFFTSRHAVVHTVRHLDRLGLRAAALRGAILCVGETTAAAARRAGFADVAVPDPPRDAARLADWWLAGGGRRGTRALFPRAEAAREDLPTKLREAGVELDEVVVYRTAAVHPSREALREASSSDALTFASPSAAHAFFEAGGSQGGAVVAAIGARTAARLAELGHPAQVVAERPDAGALVDALERYFEERSAR